MKQNDKISKMELEQDIKNIVCSVNNLDALVTKLVTLGYHKHGDIDCTNCALPQKESIKIENKNIGWLPEDVQRHKSCPSCNTEGNYIVTLDGLAYKINMILKYLRAEQQQVSANKLLLNKPF